MATTATTATSATSATSASWSSASFVATSASFASQSISASWAPAVASNFAISASWSSQSFWATSASFASRSISASWAPGGSITGTNNYVPYFVSNSLAITSSIYADGTRVSIGQGSFDTTDPEVLQVVGNSAVDANTIAAFYHTTNSFAQVLVQNKATGVTASGDLIVQSNINAIDSLGYADLGINNIGYADPAFNIGGPLDSYLYAYASASVGGNLNIGCDTAGKQIQFTVGGFANTNQIMQISDTLVPQVQITGSLAVTNGITGSTTGQGILFSKGVTFFDPAGISGTASLSQSVIAWRAPFACTASAIYGWKSGGTLTSTASVQIKKNTLPILTSSLFVTQSSAWVSKGAAALQNQNFSVGDYMEIVLHTASFWVTQVGVQIDLIRQ